MWVSFIDKLLFLLTFTEVSLACASSLLFLFSFL
jgi:hypothetical protein